MEVKLTLKFKHDCAKEIYNSILPDFGKKGRAEVNMKLKDNIINFNIISKDLTSVRATINSIILKLRTLDEMSNIKL